METMNTKTQRVLILLTLPALLLAAAGGLMAQQTDLAAPEPLTTLLAQDWELVAPSVLQRVEPNGELVTLLIGSEGYAWQVRQVEARLQMLERRAEVVDTAELRQAIRDLEDQRARLTLKAEQARVEGWGLTGESIETLEPILQTAAGCNSSLNASASAGPTSSGPQGSGSGSFSDSCGACGNTEATAYADGSLNGVYTSCYQHHPNNGCGSALSTATCSVNANTNCYSYAYGWAEIPGVGDITRNDSNYVCRPVVASISGPTSVFVDQYSCRLVTWNASASEGTPGYSYQWRYNGASVGTGKSYTRGYCSSGFSQTFYDTVSVTATDSAGDTDTASLSVRVTMVGDCLYYAPESGDAQGLDLQALPAPCIYPY
jgi:hypothetical protein